MDKEILKAIVLTAVPLFFLLSITAFSFGIVLGMLEASGGFRAVVIEAGKEIKEIVDEIDKHEPNHDD